MTDKTADFEEPGPGVVTAGDLVGLRREEWSPERLRALDRAVAEARGWRPDVGYCTPDGKASWLAPVSLGCRETFDMQAEEKIEVCFHPSYDDWWAQRRMDEDGHCGPTPPIAICLAYLASKGRPFNG